MSPQTLDILEAPLAYEEAMTTLFLPESGNILAKTIQVLRVTGVVVLMVFEGNHWV